MLDELQQANEYIINKIIEKDTLILEMEEFAKENNVPIVTKEVAEYLKFLVDSHNFKDILEIGTAIGYSGTIMGRIAKKNGGKLTTIEIDEVRYNQALDNFKKGDLLDTVNVILGDGTVEIKKLDQTFDFIFIDASKGHYMEFFKDSIERLNDNGLIFIDNIMFRGYLYKEYPKRFKTIVRRLDEFINYLYENHNFVLMPFGDGIGLVRK
ncbi:O-methyltransferase [uncultured Cetobacterium sp.]|uniref:O-methyltransferase n=1 Tax=uncultured Cetobacterium sp. TaxID=527638 RepID=UPI002610DC2C|nr:O-methyltransferase [uncultured Cetobacterium sp.]